VIDRQQIVINDGPLGGVRPRQAIEPLSVGARPVAPRIVQSSTQQQFAQSMPAPLQIFPRIIPRSRQIPDRLVFRRRRLHGRQ